MRTTKSIPPMLAAIRSRGLALIVCILAPSICVAQGANRGILIRPKPSTLLEGGCTMRLLNLRITTGNDDLRGGKNNLDVEVHFANGDMRYVIDTTTASSSDQRQFQTLFGKGAFE